MIPTFPDDATIASIHLACVHAGRSPSVRSLSKSAHSSGTPLRENLFGFNATKFAHILLGNEIYAKDLMLKHSLLPWALDGASDFGKSSYARIAAGNHPTLTSIRSAHRDIKFSSSSRICRSCLVSDMVSFGVAHLHLLHQVPGIHFCHHHGNALHDRCANCHATLTIDGEWRSNYGQCNNCGCSETSATFSHNRSPGSKAFSELLNRLLTGHQTHLTQRTPLNLLRQCKSSRLRDSKQIIRLLTDWWQVEDLGALNSVLGVAFPENRMNSFLRSENHSISYPLLTALTAFARHQLLPEESN